MIIVEWHTNEKCENCQQDKPNCAHIEMDGEFKCSSRYLESPGFTLCSDCVEDLKKRLS